jgi:putative transposase
MKQYYSSVGLQQLCGLFGRSRQAFYDHSWRHSDEQLQEGFIVDRVKQVRVCMPRIGAIKLLQIIKDQLIAHHMAIGRDSFYDVLRRHDLLIKRRKRYVKTTDSNHHYKKWPNLTIGLQVNGPEQLWVSDITYLRTVDNFIYLSLITDAWSKKIVGYHVSQYLKAQGCLISLDKAIASLPGHPTALIHHSDRGIQYCCDLYVDRILKSGIQISMTQNGSPYDNAIAERVNGILKSELGLDRTFKSYADAVGPTHQAIDTYNRLRPHLSCGLLTPNQAHVRKGPLKKLWKSNNKSKPKSLI